MCQRKREASIFRGCLRRFVGTYLSSPGDSSSGPNTTVFGPRECLIPRCCMWLLSCRARRGHIPKPRETRSIGHGCTRARKQTELFFYGMRGATPVSDWSLFSSGALYPAHFILFLFPPSLSGHCDNLTLDFSPLPCSQCLYSWQRLNQFMSSLYSLFSI